MRPTALDWLFGSEKKRLLDEYIIGIRPRMHKAVKVIFFSKPFLEMFRAHLRNTSGELDVFEAASYFSGEVNEVGLGVQRRSIDAPEQATTLFQLQPQKDLESQFKDKKEHRERSFNRKLANFVSSFFHHKLSRKKSKFDSPAEQSCENVEYVERQAVRRRSSSDHHESMRRREIIPPSDLRLPLEELKKPISVYLDREVLVDYTSAEGSSYNRAPWAEVFKQKKDRWCRKVRKRRMVEQVIQAPACLSSRLVACQLVVVIGP